METDYSTIQPSDFEASPRNYAVYNLLFSASSPGSSPDADEADAQ